MSPSGLISSKPWCTLLALAANFFVAGVPMVHALAHEISHAPHTLSVGADGEERSHDEVHPLVLHEDWSLSQNVAVHFAAALPVEPDEVRIFAVDVVAAFRSPEGERPRAPPTSVPARSPPLV